MKVPRGSIVDAGIISASSYTRDKKEQHNTEVAQTLRG